MRFLKGIFAGVISVLVGVVIISFGATIYFRFTSGPKGRVPIATRLSTLAHTPIALIAVIALFLFGVIGEMRRN